MTVTLHTSHRRPVRALLCLLLCLALSPPAQARGPGDFRGHRGGFRAQNEGRLRQMERGPRPSSPRFQQQRDAPPIDRQQPRPAAQPVPAESQGRSPSFQPVEPRPAEPSRPGRLTPDERRALRQQIDEAGRDIYRPNRP